MESKLQAGFARAEISPTICSVPMAGFGATEYRMSGVIGDPLYVNAIALRSGEETIIYLSFDLISASDDMYNAVRDAVSEKTGLPKDRIFACASHTHSGPDIRSTIPNAIKYIKEQLVPTVADAAYRALTDLLPAKLTYGTIKTGIPGAPMNFDRHYYMVKAEKQDNYTDADKELVGMTNPKFKNKGEYVYVGHWKDADPLLHVLRFTRDGADDIMMVNFTAHATFVGKKDSPLISADWPGAFVKRLEEVFPHTKCAFLQGCAGNITPGTRLRNEAFPGLTTTPGRNPRAYADVLAGYVLLMEQDGLFKESASDTIAVRQEMLTCACDHSRDYLLPKVREALALYKKEGHTHAAVEYCRSHGFYSIYICTGIERHATLPESEELELNAIRIGDCAIATLPCEPFCSAGEYIKAHSPFAMTVANGYACGHRAYIASEDAPDECYERLQMLYVPGTLEKMAEKLSEMLNNLK